jgi:nucleoside-diphosphate-sugar epimerase
VFNLAGLPPGSSGPLAAADVMWRVHVDGAAHVVRAARECGVERLVHTSSAAAVGLPIDDEPADETFPFNGDLFSGHHRAYMMSKREGERAALASAGHTLDVVVLNPCTTMAPGNHGLGRMVSLSRQGKMTAYPSGGTGLTTRRDAVDAHIKAMQRGVSGERYIVSSINITYRSLFELVARVVGSRPPRLRVPNAALRLAGRAASVAARLARRPAVPALLEPENVFLLTGTFYYRQAKAVRCLGISQSPMEDAIREVAAWYEHITN